MHDLLSWLKQALRGYEPSGYTARNRLQLVLVQDRIGLSQSDLEALKHDLMEVVSKYLVIDQDSAKMEVTHFSDSVTLVSSVDVRDIVRAGA